MLSRNINDNSIGNGRLGSIIVSLTLKITLIIIASVAIRTRVSNHFSRLIFFPARYIIQPSKPITICDLKRKFKTISN